MQMNTALLLKVADTIEQDALPNYSFDMMTYSTETECGTAACIAGYTVAMVGKAGHIDDTFLSSCETIATKALGLSDKAITRALFLGQFFQSKFHFQYDIETLQKVASGIPTSLNSDPNGLHYKGPVGSNSTITTPVDNIAHVINAPLSEITPKVAANTIRHLVETGSVDWIAGGFDPLLTRSAIGPVGAKMILELA